MDNLVQEHLRSLQEGEDGVVHTVKPVPAIVQEGMVYPFLEIDVNIPIKRVTPDTQVFFWIFVCFLTFVV